MSYTPNLSAEPAGADEIIKCLARECRIPGDDPGVHEFARMVARYCSALAEAFTPMGDADHVGPGHVHAVGSEIGNAIRSHFECD